MDSSNVQDSAAFFDFLFCLFCFVEVGNWLKAGNKTRFKYDK